MRVSLNFSRRLKPAPAMHNYAKNEPSLVEIHFWSKPSNQTTHPSAVSSVNTPDAFAALMRISKLTQCDVRCGSWINQAQDFTRTKEYLSTLIC